MLSECVALMRSYQSIQARMRCQGEAFKHSLIGAGTYMQAATGDMRWRTHWKLQCAERPMSVQQVADGRYLWIVRQFESEPVIERVELRKISEAQMPPDAIGAAPNGATLLSAGGLPRLVESFQRSFDFQDVVETRWSGIGVWAIRGELNRAAAIRLLPEQAAAINAGQRADLSKLPDYVPDHVVVFLGQQNLFPYRIEYRRGGKSGDHSSGRAILVIEFLDVHLNTPLDANSFVFDPGSAPISDDTAPYVESLVKFP